MLALISVLMGIGVGAFRRVNLGRAMAVSQVKDSLRATRLFAIEQGSESRLDFDPEEGVMVASGMIGVGNWHMEDERGWPTRVDVVGEGVFTGGGVLGRCLEFPEGGAGSAALGTSPSFDGEQGFLAELFVRPDFERNVTVMQKGDAFRIQLTADRGVTAEVRVRPGGLKGSGDPERLSLHVADCVQRGRWSRLAIAYDGLTFRLLVDGRERASRKNVERLDPLPDPDARIKLGSIDPAFVGAIDEVRLASVEAEESEPLPDGVRFATAPTVWFDGRGRLDPARHAEPVTITLEYGDETRSLRRDIVVGLLGEVQ